MKKLILATLTILTTQFGQAQMQNNIQNTINVTGEGKMSVTPDQAIITVGAEFKDKDSAKAKSQSDAVMSKMIAFLKQSGIAEKDIKTQRVNLYKSRDYQAKQDYFYASQSLSVTLTNLDNYEKIMGGLMDAGANTINGVEFKSSKVADYESEIRIKAVENAKKKAEDYARALNQKVGKAVFVSDNSQTIFPRMYSMKATEMMDASGAGQQTLAIGEIEITSNVTIAFELK